MIPGKSKSFWDNVKNILIVHSYCWVVSTETITTFTQIDANC